MIKVELFNLKLLLLLSDSGENSTIFFKKTILKNYLAS